MTSEVIRLGDVATYINGYAFKPGDWSDVGLPIIRIQDLTGTSYQLNYYDGEYPKNIEINDGDVLISWSASLGVYIWSKGKALLNQHIFKVIFDKASIDKKYFVFAVKYKLKEMQNKTHGATMKHIVKKDFDNTLIPYPNEDKRKKIAYILEKVSEIIENEKYQLELLDNLIKSRFVEMFGDIETNPFNWKKSSVGEECFYIKDGPHKSPPYVETGTGIPFISTRNVVNGDKIDWSTAKYISESDYLECIKKCKPEKGDILYSKGGTTGIAKVVDTDKKFANWVHVAVLKFGEQLDGKFFECMLNSDYCYAQSQRLTKGIANRDFVLSAIAQVKIYVPPIEKQLEYVAFVQSVDKLKSEIQKSLDETQTLMDSLMQKYFG
mgnify:CR=1 FL=1